MLRYRTFGLELASTFELPGLHPGDPLRPADVSLELSDRRALESGWSGPTEPPGTVEMRFPNGTAWRTDPGRGGDYLFTYDTRALFWLAPGADRLLCAPSDPEAAAWKRELLDSALGTVAMLHGFEGLHASSIERDGGVVAFMAPSGGGKTSLAAEFLRRGAPLFGDDLLFLRREGDGVLAYPAPPLMNVPLDHPGAISPGELGREIATLDGEAWVAVDRAAREPLPLRAVFTISPEDEAAPGAQRLDDPGPLLLLTNALRSGTAAERIHARFELMSDLAESVPQFVLQRDRLSPPQVLADRVERALAGLGARA